MQNCQSQANHIKTQWMSTELEIVTHLSSREQATNTLHGMSPYKESVTMTWQYELYVKQRQWNNGLHIGEPD